METILRNPIPGDVGWLISLHGKIYAEQFEFDSSFERDIARKVLSFLDSPDPFNMLWIATLDDKPIGSIAVSLKPNETAFINFLLVATEYRGRGVARALMDRAISHSRRHNLAVMRLETYSCLKSARELYTRYGFTRLTTNIDFNKYGQSFDQEFWGKVL
jgi:ribosomal protein S18 acetylase RimI-like enzyme